MTSTILPPPSPGARKHPLHDEQESNNVFDSIEHQNQNAGLTSSLSMSMSHHGTPPTLPNGQSRQTSPAMSTMSSGLSSVSATPPPFNQDGTPSTVTRPAKRRKYTPSEKLQNERERAKKKAKHEEEKQVKDEEKRKRNEILEERRRRRDLEKHEKEGVKRRRDEEQEKKKRAQSRISSFFAMPQTPSKSSASSIPSSGSQTIRRDSDFSHSGTNLKADLHPSISHLVSQSDYERTFLPFSLPSNGWMAPSNIFSWDYQAIEHLQCQIEQSFDRKPTEESPLLTIVDAMNLAPSETAQRGSQQYSTKEAMSHVAGSNINPIDLTQATSTISRKPLDLLNRIAIRYIHFHQDIRPPWIGTFTKLKSRSEALRLSRNPCSKSRLELDYDYDSEAEWEEPGEGEDLNSECESVTESDAEGEMDGFLDDEGAADGQKLKKGYSSRDLEPICSGLCWENEEGTCVSGLGDYRLEVIQETHALPVDPFSRLYWLEFEKTATAEELRAQRDLMDLARVPLQSRPMNRSNNLQGGALPLKQKVKPPKHSVRVLAGEDLEEFKRAVNGSDLTKVGLVAVLKKRFPKFSVALIQDTLGTVAQRSGKKESDKKWILVDEA